MADWHRLCPTDECPPGSAREFVAGGRIVALFNVEGDFVALDGICPHQGGPLGQGTLQGCVVTCPWHGWQFDVTTGQHQTNKSIRHPQLQIRVVADEVQVDLTEQP